MADERDKKEPSKKPAKTGGTGPRIDRNMPPFHWPDGDVRKDSVDRPVKVPVRKDEKKHEGGA